MMNKEIELKLNEIVKQISKNRKVEAIFLFGSQINGRARQDSDIDIAVLTKNINDDDEWNMAGHGSDKFEIHIFRKLPLIIQFRVIKEGKLLFVRDKKYVRDVSRFVISRYLDFQPFINRFYQRVIENV